MYCNSSATLYHETTTGYVVTYFPHVFWQSRRNAVTGKDGLTMTQGEYLTIPTQGEIAVSEKDFFVEGKGAPIDNTSAATIAAGIKALGKVHGIASISKKLYGSAVMRHYEFELR